MSKYAKLKAKDLPRVVVSYAKGETPSADKYAYAILGQIPVSHLIGYIVRVQAELAFRNPDQCDDCACVIMYNPESQMMDWFVDKSIPVDPLVGMLELIKCYLLDCQIASLTSSPAESKLIF